MATHEAGTVAAATPSYIMPHATHEQVFTDRTLFNATLEEVHALLGRQIHSLIEEEALQGLDLLALYLAVTSAGGYHQVPYPTAGVAVDLIFYCVMGKVRYLNEDACVLQFAVSWVNHGQWTVARRRVPRWL